METGRTSPPPQDRLAKLSAAPREALPQEGPLDAGGLQAAVLVPADVLADSTRQACSPHPPSGAAPAQAQLGAPLEAFRSHSQPKADGW